MQPTGKVVGNDPLAYASPSCLYGGRGTHEENLQAAARRSRKYLIMERAEALEAEGVIVIRRGDE